MKSSVADLGSRYDFVNYLVDCIIQLNRVVDERVSTRKIEVVKYRGSNFSPGMFAYVIRKGGINVISIAHAVREEPRLGAVISSGLPKFDIMLGGGFRMGSCILISGTTGTGKTTIASTFVEAASDRNEKTLYINFEETTDMMISLIANLGIDLKKALDDGKLNILATMPELKLAEEHLVDTFDVILDFKPNHIIIDAISACYRMGSRQAAFDYLIALISHCKQKEITCILINQSDKTDMFAGLTGIEVSSLVDSIVMVRYIEGQGELNRMLMVMKSRGFNHSNQYREFNITENGIDILDVFDGEGPVLTGVARKDQETKELLAQKQRLQRIAIQKQNLNQMRAALEANTAKYLAEIEASSKTLETLELEENMWQNNLNDRRLLRGITFDKQGG